MRWFQAYLRYRRIVLELTEADGIWTCRRVTCLRYMVIPEVFDNQDTRQRNTISLDSDCSTMYRLVAWRPLCPYSQGHKPFGLVLITPRKGRNLRADFHFINYSLEEYGCAWNNGLWLEHGKLLTCWSDDVVLWADVITNKPRYQSPDESSQIM